MSGRPKRRSSFSIICCNLRCSHATTHNLPCNCRQYGAVLLLLATRPTHTRTQGKNSALHSEWLAVFSSSQNATTNKQTLNTRRRALCVCAVYELYTLISFSSQRANESNIHRVKHNKFGQFQPPEIRFASLFHGSRMRPIIRSAHIRLRKIVCERTQNACEFRRPTSVLHDQ